MSFHTASPPLVLVASSHPHQLSFSLHPSSFFLHPFSPDNPYSSLTLTPPPPNQPQRYTLCGLPVNQSTCKSAQPCTSAAISVSSKENPRSRSRNFLTPMPMAQPRSLMGSSDSPRTMATPTMTMTRLAVLATDCLFIKGGGNGQMACNFFMRHDEKRLVLRRETFNRVDPSLRQGIRPTLNQSRPHSPRQMTSKMSPILSHQSRVSSTLEANNHAPLLDPQLASPVSVHPTPLHHLSPSSPTMQIFTSFPSSPTSLVPILSMATRPTPHRQKHKKFCRQSTSQPPSRPNPTQRDI